MENNRNGLYRSKLKATESNRVYEYSMAARQSTFDRLVYGPAFKN